MKGTELQTQPTPIFYQRPNSGLCPPLTNRTGYDIIESVKTEYGNDVLPRLPLKGPPEPLIQLMTSAFYAIVVGFFV